MEVSFRHALSSHPDRVHYYMAGDLFEMWEYTAEEHQRMVTLFVEQGAVHVWLIGEAFQATQHPEHYRCFAQTSEALQALQAEDLSGAFVWIKGSRGMALEQLLPAL